VKFIFRTLVVLLLFVNSLTAQKQKGLIYFNDGTIKEGFVKISGNEKVKYKDSSKKNKLTYLWKNISKITIIEPGNGKFHFFNIKINGDDAQRRVLQLVYEGKVNLYKHVINTYKLSPGFNFGVAPLTTQVKYISFYMNKKGEDVMFVDSNSDFTEIVKKYFSDCSMVKEKIDQKIYTVKNIQDIVFEYNYKCTNKS